MRCAVCEETVDLVDWCYSCEKFKVEHVTKPPSPRGRHRITIMDRNIDPGPCLYGHIRRWGSDRWVCDECLHRYYLRREAARKAAAKERFA